MRVGRWRTDPPLGELMVSLWNDLAERYPDEDVRAVVVARAINDLRRGPRSWTPRPGASSRKIAEGALAAWGR